MQSTLSPKVNLSSRVGPSTNFNSSGENDSSSKNHLVPTQKIPELANEMNNLKIQSPSQKSSRKKKSKKRSHKTESSSDLKGKALVEPLPQPQENGSVKSGDDDSTKQKKVSLAEFRTTLGANEFENEDPTRILWVGNIAPGVSQEDIQNEFGQFGTIESLRILHERFCAFINFAEVSSAEEAKKNLNGSVLGGQYIVINYRKSEPVVGELTPAVLNTPSSALWIGNISEELSEAELLEEFQQYGPIANVRLLKHKTCAFVNFVKVTDAITALNATQGKIVGKTALKVNFGKPLQGGTTKAAPLMFAPVVPAAYYTGGYPVMHVDPSYHYLNYATPMHSAPMHSELMSQYMGLATPNQCEICRSNFKDTMLLDCNHSCCGQCASRIQYSNQTCPFCQQHVTRVMLASYSPYIQYG